ncbi:MAG TPA: fused MFS/spermidine synthase, partial [Thermodesulfobacteriota bacterium]
TFGTRAILYGLGASLVVLAGLTALAGLAEASVAERSRAGRKAAAVGLALAALAVHPATGAARERILFEKDSAYHRIIVYEDGDSRILRFNQSRQSGMYLSDPYRLRFLYTEYASLPLVLKPDPKSVAFIGLGGGSLPKKYRRDYPSLRIDVAEIDPEVVDVAKRFFGFREDDRLRVATEDGRVFLTRRRDARYDYVFVDAYYSDAIPFHLTTVEFLALVKRRLSPDGVVAWNIIGALNGPRSRLFRSVYKTFQASFPQVYVFPVGGASAFEGGGLGNILVVGSQSMVRLSRDAFVERARALEAAGTVKESVGRHATTLFTGVIPTDDVPVLTDDYAPVDSLLHF